MSLRFQVLGSGSSGNACLLESEGFGVLLDFGLGPRQLTSRYRGLFPFWDCVDAALLTHTHGDHWNDATLGHFVERDIPLYLHSDHITTLERSADFNQLRRENLIRCYDLDHPWYLGPGIQCMAFEVLHDDVRTCGFRIDGPCDMFGSEWSIAYAADIGSWSEGLLPYFQDVDILALEFNHDVRLQMTSSRPAHLIQRVLGDRGHLSNVQAAAMLDRLLARTELDRLRHLVQLHLSSECNRPEIAVETAHRVRSKHEARFEIHATQQGEPGPVLTLPPKPKLPPRRAIRRREPSFVAMNLFADWE